MAATLEVGISLKFVGDSGMVVKEGSGFTFSGSALQFNHYSQLIPEAWETLDPGEVLSWDDAIIVFRNLGSAACSVQMYVGGPTIDLAVGAVAIVQSVSAGTAPRASSASGYTFLEFILVG